MKKQQRFYIGGLQAFEPRIRLLHEATPVSVPRLIYDTVTRSGTRKLLHYPPDTKAFLYYFTPPDKPRIAGELRLRVTSSDNPASFESGSDLLESDGQPWSRPLYTVSKCYIPLYDKLREDQLVPDDLDRALSSFPPKATRFRRSHHLYSLNDEFIIDFSGERRFRVITEQGMISLPFIGPFTERRDQTERTPYIGAYTNDHFILFLGSNEYVGSALARFERSTLPDHEGTRTIVLRYLKIISPVKCVIPFYDGFIARPKEGELFRKCGRRGGLVGLDPPVWGVNIDKKNTMMRGFQLLWDT